MVQERVMANVGVDSGVATIEWQAECGMWDLLLVESSVEVAGGCAWVMLRSMENCLD
jgi:hypothetical protein